MEDATQLLANLLQQGNEQEQVLVGKGCAGDKQTQQAGHCCSLMLVHNSKKQ